MGLIYKHQTTFKDAAHTAFNKIDARGDELMMQLETIAKEAGIDWKGYEPGIDWKGYE